MFSLDEAARYIHLYLNLSEEEAKTEIKKMAFSLMNRSGNEQFAIDETRKRVAFAVHCCREGWRPQNPVAFLKGCFRNQEYNKENWVQWMAKLLKKDKEIRSFRNEMAAMESLRPTQVLSYPLGRRAFNLIWTPVKSRVVAHTEDEIMVLLDAYPTSIAAEGRTEEEATPTAYKLNTISNIQLNKQGTVGVAVNSSLNTYLNSSYTSEDRPISYTPVQFKYGGSFLSGYLYCSTNGIQLRDGTPLTEDKARGIIAELNEHWRERIAHFVAIYGPHNIARLRDAYVQQWGRIDFSSLYFVEKFLTDHASFETLERGKVREVMQLPTHLVSA